MRLRTLAILFFLSLLAGLAVAQVRQPSTEDTLRARLASSVSVVAGTVGEPLRRIPFRGPGGEHQPDWWEAPVRVTETLSGEKQPEVIHVVFSYNVDTYWEPSPKLRPGEKAIFLLHRFDAKETEARIHHAFEVPPVEGLLVIDPLDVQPMENRARIIALSKAARSSR
jgi:hypothetical protein